MEPKIGTFHDASTGETIVRELTKDEIANLPIVADYGLPLEISA